MFCARRLGRFCCLWKKRAKFTTLYDEGYKRIKKMFNMVKIIKNIKYMKILMKNSLMSPEVKQSLEHAEKNFINLDGS